MSNCFQLTDKLFLLTLVFTLIHSHINDPNKIIHKSPVGILEPRKGGHPMKLTFFVSPYDLIDRKAKTALTLNADGE